MKRRLPPFKNLQFHLALLLTYLIWAVAGPVIKLTLDYIPPYTFLLFRFVVICVVLLPYTIHLLKTNPINPKDYYKIIILSVLAQTSLIFIFLGLKYTTALEATIIGILGPVLSLAAGNYYYHERINSRIKVGIVLALLGTLLVTLEPLLQTHEITHSTGLRLWGNFLVILNSLSFVLYIIWSKICLGENTKETKRTLKYIHLKPMSRRYSPIFLMTISFYIGLVTFIPTAVLENMGYLGSTSFDRSQMTLIPIAGILFMSILSSIVAYYLFEWSLLKIEVKETAIYSYLQPVLTVPFAYLMLGEIPDSYMILGSLVILSGVVVAEGQKS